MVNTAISHIASRICQNKAQRKVNSFHPAATDVYPGQYVVLQSSGKWTLAVNTTESHTLMTGGIVDYEKRKNDDGGTPTIDEIWDIDNEPATDKIPVVTSGICACWITDQVATVYPGRALMVSATAGSLTRLVKKATVDTTYQSAPALTQIKVATLVRKIVSGDTRGFVGIGDFINHRGVY